MFTTKNNPATVDNGDAKLPKKQREGARESFSPKPFSMDPDFLKFVLRVGGAAFGNGGITRDEMKHLISEWNAKHADKQLRFDESGFRGMAQRSGLAEKINPDEVFHSLGITRDDRNFEHSKPFLKFLESNTKGAQGKGGLTLQEVVAAAKAWNEMQKDNPLATVVVTPEGFRRLALRDSSKDERGASTISTNELRYFARGQTAPGISIEDRTDLISGDLGNWRKQWPTALPFTYDALQKAVDLRLSAVLLKDNKTMMSIRNAGDLVFKETGVSVLASKMTDSDVEQYWESKADPMKPIGAFYAGRRAQIAQRQNFLDAAVRAEEKKLGIRFSAQERSHFIKGLEGDEAIAALANLPADLYRRWTGISKDEAPYAYAALKFVGTLAATPAVAGKQLNVGGRDLSQYLRDVVVSSPENAANLFRSLNALQPGISGPERFERSLNAVAFVAAGSTMLKGRGPAFKMTMTEFIARTKFTSIEKSVLGEWVQRATLILESDMSHPGVLNQAHIKRQLDVLDSPASRQWFDKAKGSGFKLDEAKAAVAGTDLTKFNPPATEAALGFGRSTPRLAETRYVPPGLDPRANPLFNLFAHSEGGAAVTFRELVQLGKERGLTPRQAENLAQRTALHIVGHDTFRYGFGEQTLNPLVSQISKLPPESIKYPASKTPTGFIVQAVDRLEATLPETQLRYVLEGKARKNTDGTPWSVTQSIDSGVVNGAKMLKEAHAGLIKDAKSALSPKQFQLFMESPFMRDFTKGLDGLKDITDLFRKNAEGIYEMKSGKKWIQIDSFDTFNKQFLKAVHGARAGR